MARACTDQDYSAIEAMLQSNKDRIYIALYARGGQDLNTYHWAIMSDRSVKSRAGQVFGTMSDSGLTPRTQGAMSGNTRHSIFP